MKAYPRFVSRLSVVLAALPLSSPFLSGQQPVEQVPTSVVAPNGTLAVPMEELVAPIALYPDALIALILPASTVSSDVVLAARFLKSGGSPDQVDAQPWDDSVKGLAHYPDVITWMDENLAWTQRIGEAYVDQPQTVMSAIQNARTIARNNGVLVDTPQQQVVVENSYIRIIPAQPDVIYVPRYDPEIIYVQRPTYYSPDPWLTFGIGFGVGSWLAYELDWGHHSIWVDHHRHERWSDHHDWRYRSFEGRPGFVARDPYWRHWQPSPSRPRPPHRDWDRGGHDFVRPTPVPGAPHFDRDRWQNRAGSQPERYAGGSRPGVREGWERSQNQRATINSSSGGPRRSSGSGNPVINQATVAPSASVAAVAPAPAVRAPERSRSSESGVPRTGNRGANERRSGGGSVSVVPSDRRLQQPSVTSAPAPQVQSQPQIQNQGERRRGPADRSDRGDRPVRAAMPAVRNQVVASQPPAVHVQGPVAQAAPPAVHAAPQIREFRQPDRVPQAAAAPAQVHSAPPQVREAQGGGDRGSRGASNERVGRSENRGSRERQQ